MSPDRMSATSVAHKSTGGTLQSIPEPVDPVDNPSTTPGGVDFYDSRSSLVRMLLSTSLAHCEAAYKRAGVHTISLHICVHSGEGRKTPREMRRSFCPQRTGESRLTPDSPDSASILSVRSKNGSLSAAECASGRLFAPPSLCLFL
jgi:hypothetical protein